ncbi:MAG TPA: hypothetical protein V6D22_04065 [Candidatus Obscuribacterales bacterium]
MNTALLGGGLLKRTETVKMALYVVLVLVYAAVLFLVAEAIAQVIKWQRRRSKRPVVITILDDAGKVMGRERVVLSK